MTAIVWRDDYSVGVSKLDAQHKVLIDLINRLQQVDLEGGDLRQVMDMLEWYVREHFSLEEQMMRDAGYANLEPHIAEHREFEAWLKSAHSHMAAGGFDGEILITSVREHLEDWLMKHILVSDMDYKGKLSA